MIGITASLALAAALAAGPTFTPPHPVDHRPCVSAREFNGYHFSQRKADLEARWEVKGLGRQTLVPGLGRAVTYPRCGYPRAKAWYGVHYVKDARGRLWGDDVIWWHKPRPHPAPPAVPTPPPGPPQLIPA